MEDFVSRKNAKNEFRKYISKDHCTFIFYEKVEKLILKIYMRAYNKHPKLHMSAYSLIEDPFIGLNSSGA